MDRLNFDSIKAGMATEPVPMTSRQTSRSARYHHHAGLDFEGVCSEMSFYGNVCGWCFNEFCLLLVATEKW